MSDLTEVQRKALEFILTRVETSNPAPTLREICQHMGYRAIGSAQDIVAALRKKGFLEEADRQAARSLLPTEKAKKAMGVVDDLVGVLRTAITVPCLGSVPAGHPLEAVEDNVGTLVLSADVFGRKRPRPELLFALAARGESMIGAGILDGDWLVVQSDDSPDVGSIVVARVEEDATVKTLQKDRKRGFYLKPENPDFSNIYGDETPFEVIGEVLALQRHL